MNDHAELERLLADGYLIGGRIIPLSEITPESIGHKVKVYPIQTNPETLLDPANKDKSLIMLGHPSTGHQVEILTSDERTIKRANEQRRYQGEPIGTLIRARCFALGGSSSDQRGFHLDNLISSLDGLWGWQFKSGAKLGDLVGNFEVIIYLESTNKGIAEEALKKLEYLLDCLSLSQQVGFNIQHYSIAPIPRHGPTISFGSEERRLPPVTFEEINKTMNMLSSTNALVAARGLNQAYGENYMPSRLSMLWAAAETVFGSKPDPLLTREEVKQLLNLAKCIESLSSDPDRVMKLKQALLDPDRLPSISRNKRMAREIAPIMGIGEKDAYDKVHTASELRGKHSHRLSADWERIERSEKFLQKALQAYLSQQQIT